MLSNYMDGYSSIGLVNSVVEGIQEKKGTNIVILDLREVEYAICDYFVICDGNSSTHVDSIADSVEETVRQQTGEKAFHVEGYNNAQWIVLDYVDVIVHVFQRPVREYYGLEELWSDAKRKVIDNIF
ncbi:MAG: ribosome silencing factor [Breznakibacter sp.]|nr:ribosome silencing factor [Breznakibacter sp.]